MKPLNARHPEPGNEFLAGSKEEKPSIQDLKSYLLSKQSSLKILNIQV